MKSLKEIREISYGELERIAGDENIRIPEGFEQECAATIERLDRGRRRPSLRHFVSLTAVAASVAIAGWLGLSLSYRYIRPKDTYSDPKVAYAEVQKALDKISQNMNKGVESISASREMLERPAEIIKREK